MTTQLIHADCLDYLPTLADNSIDLIVTDPPYYRVKNLPWDNQWSDPAAFLNWMGRVLEQFYRVLKPNGSLYLFASPKMAARVELKVGEWFEVLNHIVWNKPQSRAQQSCKEALRCFFGASERIIFAEHHGSEYDQKCHELRGFLYAPIQEYLQAERERSGVSHRAVIQELGMAGHDTHFFSPIQWKMPLPEQYAAMRDIFARHNHNGEYLRRDYEDLRRDYEDLRRDYEDLRRPFTVSAEVPYTDVWTYATVQAYPGKHPCEKPLQMLLDIVRASSRPGGVVADFFFGSGNTAIAAQQLGRDFVGSELSEHWHGKAQQRVGAAQREMVQLGLGEEVER